MEILEVLLFAMSILVCAFVLGCVLAGKDSHE